MTTQQEIRHRIDDLDQRIVRSLAERMRLVYDIAARKSDDPSAPLRDEKREQELFALWARGAESEGLSTYYFGRILREILNYSRRVQEGVLKRSQTEGTAPQLTRVGYQGAPGSYSHLAILKLFAVRPAERLIPVGFRTFQHVADALEAGETDYALLPIENTIAGSLNEIYHLLAERKVSVVDEEILPIEHCLIGLPGATLEGLRRIRSHPVALQQCQQFLNAMGHCRIESYYDTAAAVESVADDGDPSIGAIAAAESAGQLEVLKTGIADRPANLTRFFLLAPTPEPVDLRQPAKVSLLFSVAHRHGALAECLQVFARRGLNLSKLESRPKPDSPWEYLFYLDFRGNLADQPVAATLEELRSHTSYLRLLGCYPSRELEVVELPRPESTITVEEEPTPTRPASEEPAPAPAIPLERRVVRVAGVPVGGKEFVLMAGPCAVESREQIHQAANAVKERGARILRGGAFKPRTSPHSFQGLGFPGLELLAEAGTAYEIPVVTEVLRTEDLLAVAEKADAIQVGARNMQNYGLLGALGALDKPVLLKRGMSATIEELLAAAEHIRVQGNQQIILCERGIRTFETATRSTLDVSAVPVLKERAEYPVIVDPSHAAGVRSLVIPLALAAAAAGADGLLVEVHPCPEEALCDGRQALTPEDLDTLVEGLKPILEAQGRGF
jgi:chorismate mutase/prephenate dehydratase